MTKNASPCNRLLWQTRKTDSMWRQKVIKSVNKYNHIKDFAFASHGHPHIFRSHSNDQNQFNICLLLVMERWKGSKPTANSCNTVLWLWDIYPLKTHHFPWLVIHHLPPKLLLLQHILKILHEFYYWPLQLFKLFLHGLHNIFGWQQCPSEISTSALCAIQPSRMSSNIGRHHAWSGKSMRDTLHVRLRIAISRN